MLTMDISMDSKENNGSDLRSKSIRRRMLI